MPARTHAPAGAPIWVDLFSSDPDRSTAFYAGLFGWEAEEPNAEFGGYVNFRSRGARVAGMVRNDGSQGVTDAWTTYLSTPDAAATVATAQAAGAQVLVEPMPVGDLGVMAAVMEPGGSFVGLWQPGTHTGSGRVNEAGAPCWHELHCRDYAGSLGFYRDVLGWETKTLGDTDEFRYTQVVADGEPVAGVMDSAAFLPEGVPSVWMLYLGVDDVDAACARAVELGGTVTEQPVDTPFGRMAQLADPTGAILKLHGVREPGAQERESR